MRLIDADKLHFSPRFAWTTPDREEMIPVLAIDKKWVDKAPTVDAVEVVHGRWEKAEYHGFLRCDQCKDVYINEEWLADGKWNYCPNCGAKMDGDGNA